MYNQYLTQREQHHIEIRKNNRNKTGERDIQRHRLLFLLKNSNQKNRSKNMGTFDFIRKIKIADPNLSISQQIDDLYGLLWECQVKDLIGILDNQMVTKLIQISSWTFLKNHLQTEQITSIINIRQRSLAVLLYHLNFFDQQVIFIPQFLDLFLLHVQHQNIKSIPLIINTLQNCMSAAHFVDKFLNHQLFDTILNRNELVNNQQLAVFSQHLFKNLLVVDYQDQNKNNKITLLININIQRLEETEFDHDMRLTIQALTNIFNGQVCQSQHIIIQNSRILKLCCIWLVFKRNSNPQKSLIIEIFDVFTILFRQQFKRKQYIKILQHIVINYFQELAKNSLIFKKPQYYQFKFFQILADACANCNLTNIIFQQKQLMNVLFSSQFNFEPNKIQGSIIRCIANLVLTQQIKDIICYLEIILKRLINFRCHDDQSIYVLQLKAIVEIFNFGKYQQYQGQTKVNQYFEIFKRENGVQKLEAFDSIDNSQQVSELISIIYDRYIRQKKQDQIIWQ